MAYLRFSIEVCLFVSRQVTRLSESFVAVWILADVWLFTCVCPQMRSQVEIQGEPLVAECTLEWLLPCVDKLMPFKL